MAEENEIHSWGINNSDLIRLAESSHLARYFLTCTEQESMECKFFNIRGFDGVYKGSLDFHPTGACGCIYLPDTYLFGIRCEHLMWAEGYCEYCWYIPSYISATDRSILIYGNHKGEFKAGLLCLYKKDEVEKPSLFQRIIGMQKKNNNEG